MFKSHVKDVDLSTVLQVYDEAICAQLELSDLDPMCIGGGKFNVDVDHGVGNWGMRKTKEWSFLQIINHG